MLFLLTEVLLVILIPASIIPGSTSNLQEQAGGPNTQDNGSDSYEGIMQPFNPTTIEALPQVRLFTMPQTISNELDESETKTTISSKHNNNELVNEPVIPLKRAIDFLSQNPILQSKQVTGKSSTATDLPSTTLSTKIGITDSKPSFIFGSTSSQSGSNSKNSIIFEDNTNKNPDRGTANDIKTKVPICNDTQILLRSKCYDLLSQGPCSNVNEWFIEVNGIPKCAKRPCPSPKILFKGKCYYQTDLIKHHIHNCPQGMRPYYNKDGTVECNCEPAHIRNPRDDRCFEIYRRGPCGPSQYFALVKDTFTLRIGRLSTYIARCVINPCKQEDFVCYGNSSLCSTNVKENGCVRLNSPCNEGTGLIMADSTTLEVNCIPPETVHDRIIGNVPSFSCAKGYRRDVNGVCRKTTSFEFSK